MYTNPSSVYNLFAFDYARVVHSKKDSIVPNGKEDMDFAVVKQEHSGHEGAFILLFHSPLIYRSQSKFFQPQRLAEGGACLVVGLFASLCIALCFYNDVSCSGLKANRLLDCSLLDFFFSSPYFVVVVVLLLLVVVSHVLCCCFVCMLCVWLLGA